MGLCYETIKPMNTKKLYYQYWGKASKEDNSYHLFPYHCLDVAAVASAWWQHRSGIHNGFVKATGVTEEQARAWMLFFYYFSYAKGRIRMGV